MVHIHVPLPPRTILEVISLGNIHLVSSLSSLPCSCLGLTRSGTAASCHFCPTRHGIPAPFPILRQERDREIAMGPSLWLPQPSSALCFLTHTLPGKPSRTRPCPPFPISSRQQQTTDSQRKHQHRAPAQAQHHHVNPAITGQANTNRHSPLPALHYCHVPNFNCHTARPAWPIRPSISLAHPLPCTARLPST